jgi:hypothetical protein
MESVWIGIFLSILEVGLNLRRIVGFDDLGNTDDFSTARLEYRLIQTGSFPTTSGVEVLGVISRPRTEENQKSSSILGFKSRTNDNADDDDSDWD